MRKGVKYISLNNNSDLIYENNAGLLWWVKNIDSLLHIHTKYGTLMMQHVQKNKAQNIIFKNNTSSIDLSNAAILSHIQSGINVSTNILITFIQNEILN